MIAIFNTDVVNDYTQEKINFKLDLLSEMSGKNKEECLIQAIDLLINITRRKNDEKEFMDNADNFRKRSLRLQLRTDKSQILSDFG